MALLNCFYHWSRYSKKKLYLHYLKLYLFICYVDMICHFVLKIFILIIFVSEDILPNVVYQSHSQKLQTRSCMNLVRDGIASNLIRE